jgi:diguanylate cyclase
LGRSDPILLDPSAWQTALVWTYSAVGLTILFLVTDEPIAMPMGNWIERALALACFVTATGRCAFTGLYGSGLREMLYKRGNELRDAHARIEELAQIDELTGTLNRRYIMKALNDEMERAQRKHSACSVAIIDLDFFKSINDRFGHPVGDEALRTFAIATSANIRNIDKFGRYGGEEFLLILPGTVKDAAQVTVDRLRAIIADHNWAAISDGMTLTMSAGVCQVRENDSADDLLARIDKALYRAKDAGRNCVISA